MGDHIWLGDHIVPFIDHAAHMRNDHFHFIEIEVETELELVEETNRTLQHQRWKEEWESKLQTVEAAIQCLRYRQG